MVKIMKHATTTLTWMVLAQRNLHRCRNNILRTLVNPIRGRFCIRDHNHILHMRCMVSDWWRVMRCGNVLCWGNITTRWTLITRGRAYKRPWIGSQLANNHIQSWNFIILNRLHKLLPLNLRRNSEQPPIVNLTHFTILKNPFNWDCFLMWISFKLFSNPCSQLTKHRPRIEYQRDHFHSNKIDIAIPI